jgi:L-fuconolactonase
MIDAHIHFWDPTRRDDILIVQREPSLDKRALPDDLLPLLAAAGVREVVAIQSAPNTSETEHLLAVSAPVAAVRAVVGWVDLAAPDCGARLVELARRPKLAGVRAMLNRAPGVGWLASPAVRPGLVALAASGLSLDLITRTEHVPEILEVAAAVPELTLIIDHGASAPTGQASYAAWMAAVAELGNRTHAFTKFSGLAEEVSAGWTAKTLEPAFRHLLSCFGPDRIMWASNWPVIDLRGGYARWVEASRELLDRAGLSASARNAIEVGTACRAYRFLAAAGDR